MAVLAVARVDAVPSREQVESALQPRDLARFGSMTSEKRRSEFVAGRWLLGALAKQVGLASVAFDTAPGGAGPVVLGAAAVASLTHAGGWVACALSAQHPLGIDLETLRERDVLAMAAHAFPQHVEALARLQPHARLVEFYRLWTGHEARVKCNAAVLPCASWLRPGQWVLSLCTDGVDAIEGPWLWDVERQGFSDGAATLLRLPA